MTIEVLPIGTRCSLECRHCYQNPMREASAQAKDDYDMEAMKKALGEENYKFTIFGGEPLLFPINDLEELWRWGKEKFGQNGVQTSATVVTERHFELFRKYNVSVGISIEGPDELNDIRWAGSIKRTREATKRAQRVLHRLLEEHHPVSLITTLNRANAAPDRLPRFLEWYKDLDRRGLQHVNLHLMEIEKEKVREDWALSEKENTEAILACANLQTELRQLRFQPITDMVQILLGDDKQACCTWNGCDPYTTRAVQGINGRGDRINCSRANKAGVDMQKADRELLVRPVALYHLPQKYDGCKDCRFWFACKGGCPGASIGGDWRWKSEHCRTVQNVFEFLETRLAMLGFRPISLNGKNRGIVENKLLESFAMGRQVSIKSIVDGKESSSRASGGEHGDRAHGDHNDTINPVIIHGDSG